MRRLDWVWHPGQHREQERRRRRSLLHISKALPASEARRL